VISGEGVAVFYSERRRELLMLSLIRGGEKAASHNLGLQSEQKKERTWGQEVTVLPPPAQSCQGYSRNIVMWRESVGLRREGRLYMCIIHTLSSSLH